MNIKVYKVEDEKNKPTYLIDFIDGDIMYEISSDNDLKFPSLMLKEKLKSEINEENSPEKKMLVFDIEQAKTVMLDVFTGEEEISVFYIKNVDDEVLFIASLYEPNGKVYIEEDEEFEENLEWLNWVKSLI